jgi:serine/threonine-protein kinase
VLLKENQRQEATEEFSEAKRLKPGDSMVRHQIGKAWSDWGDLDAAVSECREAVREKPSSAFCHSALGHALLDAGRAGEAIAQYREAIRLDPQSPPARVGLASALLASGDFAAALDAVRNNSSIPWPEERSNALVARSAERMIALLARLPAFLKGNDRPGSISERIEFARLCALRQLYATSARVWAELLAAKPDLAPDVATESYYEAARAAALASCGRGREGVLPDSAARKQCRDQAAGWINRAVADLTARVGACKPTERFEVAKRVGRWRVDPGLGAIRDESALAALRADERQALRDLWARVIAVQEQARGRIIAEAAGR